MLRRRARVGLRAHARACVNSVFGLRRRLTTIKEYKSFASIRAELRGGKVLTLRCAARRLLPNRVPLAVCADATSRCARRYRLRFSSTAGSQG